MPLVTASCGSSKLEAIAESIDNQCPISLGSMGYMAGAACSGDDIVFTTFVEEAYNDPAVFEANKDLWKRSVIQGMSGMDNPVFKEAIKEIADAGGNIKLDMRALRSEASASLTLSSEELQDIAESEPNPIDLLEARINLDNIFLPMVVDEGMKLTEVAIEGRYIVLNYVLDEDLYDVEELDNAETKEAIREYVLEQMDNSSDPAVNIPLKWFKEAGKGIAWRLIGNVSGREAFVVAIEPDR